MQQPRDEVSGQMRSELKSPKHIWRKTPVDQKHRMLVFLPYDYIGLGRHNESMRAEQIKWEAPLDACNIITRVPFRGIRPLLYGCAVHHQMLRNLPEAVKKTKRYQSEPRYTNISHRVRAGFSSEHPEPLHNSQHVPLGGRVQQKQREVMECSLFLNRTGEDWCITAAKSQKGQYGRFGHSLAKGLSWYFEVTSCLLVLGVDHKIIIIIRRRRFTTNWIGYSAGFWFCLILWKPTHEVDFGRPEVMLCNCRLDSWQIREVG